MEVLKVWWYIGNGDFGDADATYGGYLSTVVLRSQDETASAASLSTDIGDNTTFAAFYIDQGNLAGAQTTILPVEIDMTDNNGNGFLVATDQFFATAWTLNNTTPIPAQVKILYRQVNVGIIEYVGIVASQN